ncbi:MAG: hypothetical protein QE263_08360 [Vampirovibrionales bacterium]|nr:hypothetical protein [Vampirovibrionales bacterium]
MVLPPPLPSDRKSLEREFPAFWAMTDNGELLNTSRLARDAQSLAFYERTNTEISPELKADLKESARKYICAKLVDHKLRNPRAYPPDEQDSFGKNPDTFKEFDSKS